jgi:DNA-binding NarL/FixJ family response regulator
LSTDDPKSGFGQGLSAREIEVLQSISEGRSNKEIAVLLGVATKTTERFIFGEKNVRQR